MGAAWCRERVQHAHNSKSPVDRILIRCSRVLNPGVRDKVTEDFVYRGVRARGPPPPAPVPVHVAPPRAHRAKREQPGWQDCSLQVPDSDDRPEAPVPPPRKRRKRRVNSLEILNTQLQLLRQPGYVQRDMALSENLLKYEYLTQLSSEDCNFSRPASTPSLLESSSIKDTEIKARPHLYVKAAENKWGRVKKDERTEPDAASPRMSLTNTSSDGGGGDVKNDNTKKMEQKIKVKNFSTVSLPNYNELGKPSGKLLRDLGNGADGDQDQSTKSKPFVRVSSAQSLPPEGTPSILSTLSEVTMNRLEAYMKRCRSFGALKPQQILQKLEEFDRTGRSASESSDSWAGLDDWDLGVIEYWDPDTAATPPLEPKSKLTARARKGGAVFSVGPPDERTQSRTALTEESTEQALEAASLRQDVPFKPEVGRISESEQEFVPGEWLEERWSSADKVEEEKEQLYKIPPPTPENSVCTKIDDPVPEQPEHDSPHSSLWKILEKYRDQDVSTPSINVVEENLPVPPSRKSRDEGRGKQRKRSSSLRPDHTLQVPDKHKNRSLSVSFESPLYFPEIEELRDRYTPEDAANSLNKKLLPWDLPEDAFDMLLSKKRPSLRQSLSLFLGFEQQSEVADKEELDDDATWVQEAEQHTPPPLPLTPPPLPLSPPPPLYTSTSLETVLTSPSLVKLSDQNKTY